MPDSRWKLISICTLCEEGDPRRKSRSNLWSIFLSTPSVRRATPSRHFLLRADAYFYPRPPRGGRQPGLAGRKDISYFYPRPPRGGRRLGQTGRATQFPISISALREEGDRTLTGKWPKARAFLSTPSARRATLQCLVTWSSHRYFYPRPPRGGRPSAAGQHAEPDRFLSTPSARRATPRPQKWPWYKKFLSTPSARRATLRSVRQDVRNDISIHALREEGDLLWEHFENLMGQFLSTPSARRATTAAFSMTTMSRFLSTPSARRATRRSARGWSACINFYPRPPRGGRQDALDFLFEVLGFLSTPSARRATRFASSVLLSGVISIHALREEGDART